MLHDRGFYILWCSVLSGYAESYYEKKTDAELEAEFERLVIEKNKEFE